MIYIINIAENFSTHRAQRNVNVARALSDAGMPCKLISGNFDHGGKCYISSEDPRQILIPLLPYKSHFSVFRLVNHVWFSIAVFFICMFSRRLQGILVSSIPSELIFATSVVKRFRSKVRCVVDVRDIWPHSLPLGRVNSLLGRLFIPYSSLLNKLSFSAYDEVMIANPDFSDFVQSFGVFGKLVPLGYDSSRFPHMSAAEDGYVYVGNLNESFDLRVFKEFLATKERITVIGDGPLREAYVESYKNACFTGLLDPNDVALLLAKHRFGLLPITGSATLPNKLFDYYACGLAVLTNSRECADFWSNGMYSEVEPGIYIVESDCIRKDLMIDYDDVSRVIVDALVG